MKPGYIILIVLAVAAVAVADIFLKQSAKSGEFVMAVRSPWFWGGVGLYLFQVVAFTYLFASNVELTVVGIVQTALYAVVILGAGYFLYRESLSPSQYAGLALALVGVFLINWKL